jgi:hypothetical protein
MLAIEGIQPLKPYESSTRPWPVTLRRQEDESENVSAGSRLWYNRQIGFLVQHELDGWSDRETSTTTALEESDSEIDDTIKKFKLVNTIDKTINQGA